MKLRVFGLDGWIDFEIGAYGDDEFDRSALVPLAWRRTLEHRGESYGGTRTVIIGDTVRDVQAALAHGTGIVAVASGHTSAEELRDAGARDRAGRPGRHPRGPRRGAGGGPARGGSRDGRRREPRPLTDAGRHAGTQRHEGRTREAAR